MTNAFGFPSPYPDTGGDLGVPQPGTPAWAAWLASISGQGPMAGQDPRFPSQGVTTPLSGQSAPIALPGATPSLPIGAVARGPNDEMVNAPGGKQPSSTRGIFTARRVAPPAPPLPPPRPPNFGNNAPTPVADPEMLYPARATTPGYGPPPQPAYNPLSGGSANTGAPPAVTPVADPEMLYPRRAIGNIPGAPQKAGPVVPNLGYYRPSIGNAQGNPTWMPPGAPATAPQMFRGPLALPGSQNYYGPPAAAAAAAPGAGTPWWRKLIGA